MTCAGRLAFIVCFLAILLNSSDGAGQTITGNDNRSRVVASKPVADKIIISVYQEPNEADCFGMLDDKVSTRFQRSVSSQLESYGIKKAIKTFHRGINVTYELTFDAAGREDEIVAYLRSMPNVRYAQRDYTVEWLTDPDDFFYQPDSLAPLQHWIPDTMNVIINTANTGLGRTCDPYYECCPVESLWYHSFQMRDSLHLSDNWYLQHIQANKAWDIEKGSPDVKIMIMDSGIAIEHPDLAANIWDNPDGDPEGDVSGDGVPGTKGQDVDGDGGKGFNDPEVGASDINGNGIPLWGPDQIADCGPDGDYGFGPNGIDDLPLGPGSILADDDTLIAGAGNDPWDDNLRGPASLNPDSSFNDDIGDMGDVQLMKNDDNEDGYPDDFCGLNFYDPYSSLVPREDGCPNSANSIACHGTEMAGIVGAVTDNSIGMAGVVWNCKLVAARIAPAFPESKDAGSVIPIARALYYAVDKDVAVVNMSFGLEAEIWNVPAINEAIDTAYAHGVIMVAGAGNTYDEKYLYPASNPHVICASGCTRLDHEATNVSYGDSVDVCGVVSNPGSEARSWCISEDDTGYCNDRGAECIVTAYLPPPQPIFNWGDPNLPYGYAVTSLATSGATAQVSGLSALLVSLYPKSLVRELYPDPGQYTYDEFYAKFIEQQIKRGCVPISGAHASQLGAGRINAYRSLTQWGHIRNDTTWTKFAYVSADLQVDAGKTLTIEPGTVIYFAPDDNDNIWTDTEKVAIDVWGTLIANGTEENPIVFKSLSDSPEPGDWYGINFCRENSSGSLSHCNIQDAKYGVRSKTTITMNACEISNCSIAGIYLYDDMDSTCVINNESTIRHCTISENDYSEASAMRIWNCPLEITVDSCTVNMNYRGIWVSNARPAISCCEIANNMADGIWVTSYRYPLPYPYPTISWCHIRGNGDGGIYCMYNEAQVTYTKIWENGEYGLLAYGQYAYPEIDHSKIINNMAYGVRAEVGGMPILGIVGLGKGQNNSIYGHMKDVYNANSTTLCAENCWWGVAPPDRTQFYGIVDYIPFLTSDPLPNLAPSRPTKMPPVFALAQNYPNPFGITSEATLIRYSIPSSGKQTVLRIYDVSGRLVRTLVNGARDADQYVVTWDGKNEQGTKVAAGIYFCKLEHGSKSMTKKMVLFR